MAPARTPRFFPICSRILINYHVDSQNSAKMPYDKAQNWQKTAVYPD
tara:strand:- start:302 stop:442 length:141 start_codon:yes stop_codon:yes gene_type:complete